MVIKMIIKDLFRIQKDLRFCKVKKRILLLLHQLRIKNLRKSYLRNFLQIHKPWVILNYFMFQLQRKKRKLLRLLKNLIKNQLILIRKNSLKSLYFKVKLKVNLKTFKRTKTLKKNQQKNELISNHSHHFNNVFGFIISLLNL